jgi:hypothetical protein
MTFILLLLESHLPLYPVQIKSLCQYMSMYVYHVNNGDGNLNCIICA